MQLNINNLRMEAAYSHYIRKIIRGIKLSQLTGKKTTGITSKVKKYYDNLFSKTTQLTKSGFDNFIFYKTDGVIYLCIDLNQKRIDYNISYIYIDNFDIIAKPSQIEELTNAVIELYLLDNVNEVSGTNLKKLNGYVHHFSGKLTLKDSNIDITSSKKIKVI